ncbi:hypothetical protein AFLA_006747 [Aspergillus flavus NRRL3357]|nr:hypothetical protein AFLA_006747 [Aspergillus flavus NRRL3357]
MKQIERKDRNRDRNRNERVISEEGNMRKERQQTQMDLLDESELPRLSRRPCSCAFLSTLVISEDKLRGLGRSPYFAPWLRSMAANCE